MGLLDNILGGGNQQGGMSPINMALMGLLAYRTYEGKGRLAEMMGRTPPGTPADPNNPPQNQSGGLGGLLGGGAGGGLLGGGLGSLLGGNGGSILSGGLSDLINKFQQNGHGDVARSWVASGPNQTMTPAQLAQALGPETVRSLAQQSGLSEDALLAGLAKALPSAVDKLTPEGRLPTEQEAGKFL